MLNFLCAKNLNKESVYLSGCLFCLEFFQGLFGTLLYVGNIVIDNVQFLLRNFILVMRIFGNKLDEHFHDVVVLKVLESGKNFFPYASRNRIGTLYRFDQFEYIAPVFIQRENPCNIKEILQVFKNVGSVYWNKARFLRKFPFLKRIVEFSKGEVIVKLNKVCKNLEFCVKPVGFCNLGAVIGGRKDFYVGFYFFRNFLQGLFACKFNDCIFCQLVQCVGLFFAQ